MEKMKTRGLLLFVLNFTVMCALFSTCASKPKEAPEAAQTPPVAEEAAAHVAAGKVTAPEIPDDEFQKEYDKHQPYLIMDGAKKHKVVWKDTLVKIARKQYGRKNAFYFPLIMLASNDVVKNPDSIRYGMVLTVPDLKKNLKDPEARANIKLYLVSIADLYKRAKKYPRTQAGLRKLAKSL